MKQNTRLAIRFREILLSGQWVVSTNYKAQLADLTWEQATAKIDGLNSIADLAFHIDYYIAGVLKVLRGGSLDIKDKFSFDAPSIESQEDWEKLRNKLLNDAEKFADELDKMPEKQLVEVFVEERYGDYQKNINALIEHSYYHLGQIVMIKKLLLKSLI